MGKKRFLIALICLLVFLILACSATDSGTQKPAAEQNPFPLSDSREFVMVWKIEEGQTIGLPLYEAGTYDFAVDWGDGFEEYVSSYSGTAVSHRYEKEGEYTVTITGKLEGWSNQGLGLSVDRLMGLIRVESWGEMTFGDKGFAFAYAKDLVSLPEAAPDLRGISNMHAMFMGAHALTGGLLYWDVSKVTNMFAMFGDAKSFNEDISGWQVESVTQMGSMFLKASSFDQDISGWKVAEGIWIEKMFDDATAFLAGENKKKIEDSTTWGTQPSFPSP